MTLQGRFVFGVKVLDRKYGGYECANVSCIGLACYAGMAVRCAMTKARNRVEIGQKRYEKAVGAGGSDGFLCGQKYGFATSEISF